MWPKVECSAITSFDAGTCSLGSIWCCVKVVVSPFWVARCSVLLSLVSSRFSSPSSFFWSLLVFASSSFFSSSALPAAQAAPPGSVKAYIPSGVRTPAAITVGSQVHLVVLTSNPSLVISISFPVSQILLAARSFFTASGAWRT